MSTLAFNKEGEPFSFDPRTEQLRLRRFRKPGTRGTCEAVLDEDGEQIYIGADADYAELRQAVDNVPGFYRLDQCDEAGQAIAGLPAAYVPIEATRRNGASSEGDAMAIVRELAAINAEITKTMADRFAAVMQSTAEILRAADGAGIAHRKPPAIPATVVSEADTDDDDDDMRDDEPAEPDPWAAWHPLIKMAEPHLPKFGAFLYEQFVVFMTKNNPTPPTVVPAQPAPAPIDASATTVNQSAEPTGAAVGSSSTATTASTNPPPSASTPASAATVRPATASDAHSVGAATNVAPVAATTATTTTTTTTATPTATPSTAITPLTEAGAPRNAMQAPTPAQWEHLHTIRERLSPQERTIAESAITRMTPDVLARWLAELSAVSVSDAVRAIRAMIAKLKNSPASPERG